jgi:hypothetical protein
MKITYLEAPDRGVRVKTVSKKFPDFHSTKQFIGGFEDSGFLKNDLAERSHVITFMLRVSFGNGKRPLPVFVTKSGIKEDDSRQI